MVILYSPFKQVEYITGRFQEKTGKFLEERRGYVDYGRIAYASVDVQDEKGDYYLLSWAPGWFSQKKFPFKNWSGCIATPRKIGLDSQGRLIQRPCTQMDNLRQKKILLEKVTEREWMAQKLPLQLEINIILSSLPEGKAELEFLDSETGRCIQRLTYENSEFEVDGEKIKIDSQTIDIHCYCDGFLCEYFLDEGRGVITSGVEQIPEKMDVCLKFQNSLDAEKCCVQAELWKIIDAKFRDCML